MAPYDDDLDDWSSFISSLVLTLTTLSGFVLMIKTDRPENFVLAPGIITTFLIVSNAAVFVYQIVVIGYVGYQERLEKKLLLSAKKSKTQVKPINNNLTALEKQIAMEDNAQRAWNQ